MAAVLVRFERCAAFMPCKEKQFDMYVQLLFDPPDRDPSQQGSACKRDRDRETECVMDEVAALLSSLLPSAQLCSAAGEAVSMGLENLVEALCPALTATRGCKHSGRSGPPPACSSSVHSKILSSSLSSPLQFDESLLVWT